MKKIINNSIDFERLLSEADNTDIIFDDYEIYIDKSISIDISKKSFEFRNCILSGERIDFFDFDKSRKQKHEFHTLSFNNCFIENDLFVKDCYLYQVIFNNVKISSKLFYISSSEIKYISLTGRPNNYNLINNLLVWELSGVENFDFRLNEIVDSLNIIDNEFNSSMINKNKINRLIIQNTKFNDETDFWDNILLSYSSIRKSTFKIFNSKMTNFGKEINIQNCKFEDNCNFENVQNNKTDFKIDKCNFDKYVYFDSANLYSLIIESSFFKEIISFQNATFNKIKFNRTHFEKIAFFNNINILSKQDLDLNTVRTIKTHLLRTENKIDYLDFKKLEFELFRKSLKNDRTGSKIILWLNKFTSDYNTNWTRGIIFTLGYGLIFYIVLFLLVFGINNPIFFIENKFWLGYFKFLIIPDFKSPFGEENFLDKWYQYLFFIFGKIAVAYGLYETIQSFRKYGK